MYLPLPVRQPSGLGATFFDCSRVENGVHVGNVEPPPGTACGWNYTLDETAESSLASHAMQLAIRFGIAHWNDFNQGPLGNNKVAEWRQSGAEPYIRGDWINSLVSGGDLWNSGFLERVKSEFGHLTINDWPGARGAAIVARPTSAEILAANPGAFASPELVKQAEANLPKASPAATRSAQNYVPKSADVVEKVQGFLTGETSVGSFSIPGWLILAGVVGGGILLFSGGRR